MTGPGRLDDPRELGEILGIPFSREQLAVITAPLEPGVVIAGAGSGKTTVMAARVVWLVGRGEVGPDQVLGLTFTRKAAAELASKVAEALSRSGVVDPDILADADSQAMTTYDSFASRLVAEHAPRIGVDPAVHTLTEATRYRLADRVVTSTALPLDALAGWSPRRIVGGLLRLDSSITQHLVADADLEAFTDDFFAQLEAAPLTRGSVYRSIETAKEVSAQRMELLALVQEYRAAKKRLGWVEFADQMALAAQIAEQAAGVPTMLRNQYRVLLLDEYQDTSSAQARLLMALFSGEDPAHGRGHPVTAVGDPYQGIYGWRGAAASNIAEFSRNFPRKDGTPAKAFTLLVNRRSGPEILEAANLVAANLVDDVAMPKLPGIDLTLSAAPNAPRAHVHTADFISDEAELDWVADDIAARGSVEGYQGIAVLVRRNAVIEPLYAKLAARDVPVEIVGLSGLFTLTPISEIIATLRLLDDDTDNPALVQLLTSRRWQIGLGDLAALGTAAGVWNRRPPQDPASSAEKDSTVGLSASTSDGLDDSGAPPATDPASGELEEGIAALHEQARRPVTYLMDVLDPEVPGFSAQARERIGRFVTELSALRRHLSEPLTALVRRIVTAMDLETELAADPDFRAQNMGAQLARFQQVVADFTDLDGGAELSGFLSYAQSVIDEEDGLEQDLPVPGDAVSLLSIHRAKGLEWDTVYLPSLVQGTFPSSVGTENWVTVAGRLPAPLRGDASAIPQLREVSDKGLKTFAKNLKAAGRFAEDRLAYVAFTRARHTLIATTHTWQAGLKRPKQPSDYFSTLVQVSGGRMPDEPDQNTENPLAAPPTSVTWPQPVDPERAELLGTAASIALRRMRRAGPLDARDFLDDESATRSSDALDLQLSWDEQQVRRDWISESRMLIGLAVQQEEDARRIMPVDSLSASALVQAGKNPREFLESQLRPMPRKASGGAGVGTRFHEWLEARFRANSGLLVDDDELAIQDPDADVLPGRMDAVSQRRLERLQRQFERGEYADRTPARVEAPFVLVLGRRHVRGRIDAVYELPEGSAHRYQVVDWKTFDGPADPLQLALYRLAWAEVTGVDLSQVDAVFYHVMSKKVERPDGLADRRALIAMADDLPSDISMLGR